MGSISVLGGIQPDEWFLCFHTKAAGRFMSLLAMGKFKHVSAFGYYPRHRRWLIYSVNLTGVDLAMYNDSTDLAYIVAYTRDAVCVRFAARSGRRKLHSRLGFYCVPAIKNLIGLSCLAVTPGGLYRAVIRNGGVLCDGWRQRAAGS